MVLCVNYIWEDPTRIRLCMLASSHHSSAGSSTFFDKGESREKTGSTQLVIAEICKELRIPLKSPERASDQVPPT